MTPAIRLLQREGIAFTQHSYHPDPDAESYAADAAIQLGVEPGRLFKTLVCRTDRGDLMMVLVPGASSLDLKALARVLSVKKVELADPTVAERTTGYVVGGISPLGGRRALSVILDQSVNQFTTVFCSAGRRGLQIELTAADLIRLTDAQVAAVAG